MLLKPALGFGQLIGRDVCAILIVKTVPELADQFELFGCRKLHQFRLQNIVHCDTPNAVQPMTSLSLLQARCWRRYPALPSFFTAAPATRPPAHRPIA